MKKFAKIAYVILFVVLILVLAAAMAVKFFAGWAVKTGIETAATKALNVGVSVGNVNLSILAGKIEIENLSISNPPGYQYDRLLGLKKAKIEVAMKSLLGETVDIREINLDGVEVFLEQRGVSGNNLQDIISSIPARESGKSEGGGKKLRIDNLEITNVTVKAKLLPIPGKSDTVTLKLSPIKMTNLGGDNKLDTAGLSSKVLWAIADGVTRQGTDILPNELVNAMKSTLGKTAELGEAISKEGGNIIKAGKGAIEEGKDIGKGITEGFKGLFKPKKDDK